MNSNVLAAYAKQFAAMHSDATVESPDAIKEIGKDNGIAIYRVVDGWGEYYFADPPRGEAYYIASKQPDVMAYDIADKFSGKMPHIKELGMGDAAWDKAVLAALKGVEKMADTTEIIEKAEWTAAFINDLPDSSFAYIEPGGAKDGDGKTTPRGLRHLPYKGADGAVDLPHLRNALARVQQASLPKATKDRIEAKLQAVAGKHDVGDHAKDAASDAEQVVAPRGPRSADAPRPDTKEKDVHWPVDGSRFRGSSLTDAGEKAPNQKKDASFEKEYAEFKQQVADAVKAAAGPGSRVQTLIFDKDKYKTAQDAKDWAGDHSFKAGKVDETDSSFRLRQEDPGAFDHMRTISLTAGVQAVVGFPKKAIKAVTEAFFLTNSGRLAFKSADLAVATFEAVEETDGFVVYRVEYVGKSYYYAEAGGVAAPVPGYQHERILNKSVMVFKGSSDEQRYTLSVVYPASKKNKPEPDFHGDIMSEQELEKSAWGFMGKGQDRIGLMHRPGTAGAGKVVESYIWRGPEWKMKDAGGSDQAVSPGDWVMGIVWSPEAWTAIKSGQLTGLSLQGAARKEAF